MQSISAQDKEAPRLAAETLKSGELIVYPTDTIYGLGADATNLEAVKKIWEIKRRPPEKGLLVMMRDLEMARRYVEISERAEEIADAFLPGPLAIELPRSAEAPDTFMPWRKMVSIRIPDHKFREQLFDHFDRPVISTSVNISGEPSLHTPQEIKERFGREVALLVDAGELHGSPSTLVAFEDGRPVVLREGAIPASAFSGF